MKKFIFISLIVLTPLLTAATCNLGTFAARQRQHFYSSEAYEQGINDVVVDYLIVTPLPTLTPTSLPTLTPTPTPTPGPAGSGSETGDSKTGAPPSLPGGELPADITVTVPLPTITLTPIFPTPTLTLFPTLTAIPTPTTIPTLPTLVFPTATPTLDSQPPSPPTATLPPLTPTVTITPIATATPTPDLSASLKISNPTGEVFPSAPLGDTPITYTIAVRNSGPGTVTGVTVRDALPPTFTLSAATIYGPPYTVNNNTIVWGPFDLPPISSTIMGFQGAWPYNPPSGSRGRTERNTAVITAPWMSAPLYRNADIYILYPPVVSLNSATFTPTIVLQNQVVNFQIEATNSGSAATTVNTNSYMTLANITGTTVLTTYLTAPVFLPADNTPYLLTFGPASMVAVPADTYQVNISLEWLDENSVTDGDYYPNVSVVTVQRPPHLQVAATPAAGSTIPAGTAFYPRFYVWNDGGAPGNFQLNVDSIEFTGSSAWRTFAPYLTFGFPCTGDGSLWNSTVLTTATTITVRYTITSSVCGDPYLWNPEPPPDPPVDTFYSYFDLLLDPPTITGTYTITVRSTLDGGATVFTQTIPYQVN